MDEKKAEHLKTVPPSLTAAIRRARIEGAEQNQAVADLREAEIARLQLLEESVRPVLDQLPETVDLFDAGIAYGERPRLFIDMIGFVEMAHDRRAYRFLQDTRHGRVLIAESERIDRVVAAITNYIGRRLVERERALASDWRSKESEPSPHQTRARAAELARGAEQGAPAPEGIGAPAPAGAESAEAPRGWLNRLADLFSFVLLALGSMTFCLLIGVALYAAWELWGRALWTAWFGPVGL
jgi:hypothetical protein